MIPDETKHAAVPHRLSIKKSDDYEILAKSKLKIVYGEIVCPGIVYALLFAA